MDITQDAMPMPSSGLKRPRGRRFEHLLYSFSKGCFLCPEVKAQCLSSHSSQKIMSWEPKWLIYSFMGKFSQDIVIFLPKRKIQHSPAEGWLIWMMVGTLKNTNICHILKP